MVDISYIPNQAGIPFLGGWTPFFFAMLIAMGLGACSEYWKRKYIVQKRFNNKLEMRIIKEVVLK